MAELLNFDVNRMDELISRYGVRQLWKNILATRIQGHAGLKYILDDNEFSSVEILDDDLIFGLSIGEIGVLYEYCVASADSTSRKDNGQFFTPDDVAKFMVSKCLDFPSGKWLDPCSGIGNLAWHLVNAQVDKEDFLINKLILSDIDDLALLIARVLFTIDFQDKHDFLFNEIQGNFVQFDFLSAAENGSLSLFGEDTLGSIPTHDFIIMNPPYLATKSEDKRFETYKSGDLYGYFLENAIKTSEGFVSITPQSFTNAGKFSDLRNLLLKKFNNLTIYNFDNIPGNIFKGIKFGSTNTNKMNSIRVAITVAKPGKGKNHITSLMRWRTSEREEMFANIENFLCEIELSEEYFPKVSSVFKDLYTSLGSSRKLGEILAARPTEHALYVPSAPRYFIPALIKPVSRTSQRTLYFNNAKDMQTAYLVINSSLMYWWWRVRDGGMTLSLETLKGLPIPEFKINKKLITELEESEKVNRVYKRNAGADQENVKHPSSLISKLNNLVMPEFKEQLISTHENSELVQMKFMS